MGKIFHNRQGIPIGSSIKQVQDAELLPEFRKGRPGLGGIWQWRQGEYSPARLKLSLYRFLRDNIPLLGACIWTWSRLSAAPGNFAIIDPRTDAENRRGLEILTGLADRVYPFQFQRMAGMESFLPYLFSSLYTDGAVAGFVILKGDHSGIDKFLPVDPAGIMARAGDDGRHRLYLDSETGPIDINRPDFYYLAFNADNNQPLGRSLLATVPFVSYIQQQLISDMQKTAHNAGYHRLHVKITPPERQSGETDPAYVARVNEYFDDTVAMVRGVEPEDNPVTWDNVKIDYIGPGAGQSVTGSWFMTHRAMIEEICAGTNLSPFMLGYSYGTTHNWAQFKYDLVMRQAVSVQNEVARFLEWLGNLELALKGCACRCRWTFDNTLTYLAGETSEIRKSRIEAIIDLFKAGLISKEKASLLAEGLL